MEKTAIEKHTENLKNYQIFKRTALLCIEQLLEYNDFFINGCYEDMYHCGDRLDFSFDGECYRLCSANFCRKRICPMCQWRKSEKQFANCLKLSEVLEKDGYRFLHLVLTIPNCKHSQLAETVKKLFYSFGKFWHYKEIKRAFKGALRCLELSYNYENNTFHPHLHCLIAVKKSYFNDSKVYLSYDRLRELWSKSVGSNELLQISIGAIKNNLGFAEVSKYCVKPLEMKDGQTVGNQDILTALMQTLKGTRFVQSYGIVRDKLRELKLTDEPSIDDNASLDSKQMFGYTWDYIHSTYTLTAQPSDHGEPDW